MRAIAQPSIHFGTVATGSTSAPQSVTLTNSGNASLTVASIAFNGPFSNSGAGTCSALPITLAAGANCILSLVYQPASSTGVAGSAQFMAGGGGAPQLLLTGDEGTTTTTLKLVVNPTSSTYGQPVTLSATLSAAPASSESITFTSNGQTLATVPLNGNTATLATSALGAGSDTILATYNGDTMLSASTSNSVIEPVAQATPVLTWSPSTNQLPTNVVIPASVLDATASVPGSFAYSTTVNGMNIVLTAGSSTLPAGSYTFVVNFTPSYGADYLAASATIPFTITTESVWLANNNQTFSIFSLAGAPITGPSGSGRANFGSPVSPRGLAFDGSGNAYVLTQNNLFIYPPTLSNLSPTPLSGGGLSLADAVAIDGAGDAWIVNRTGTLSVFTSAGVAVTPSTGYPGVSGVSQTQFLTIDNSGNVWVTTRSNPNVLVEEFLGAAAPVAPTASAIANGTTGARP